MIKVGFFGTPDIARYCFERLCGDFDVVFAVTCEDKPRGRCLHVCSTPVKESAEARGIPVLQPENLKSEETLAGLASYNADIFVVVAYGKIIPRSIFSMPRLGTINMHPSLLPKYRGAAPVQWALINGDAVSGITVQLIDERLDAGDIVLQKQFTVDVNADAASLYEQILPESYVLVRDAVNFLGDGKAVPVKQNEADATYCKKIDRETARIDFSHGFMRIHNLIRGLNPKPGAWCLFRGKNMKIWKTEIVSQQPWPEVEAGTVFALGKKNLYVKTCDGALGILQIQPENKKVMSAVEFINGTRLAAGDRFE